MTRGYNSNVISQSSVMDEVDDMHGAPVPDQFDRKIAGTQEPTVPPQRPTTAPLPDAGQHIGHYKLLQKIGQGGFGIVFMAEQQKPIVRRVALKIIKMGMDTKQVIARFDAERQALAMMDHPNIAKVLDAGATDSGRPYFVMELVKGIPITEYCDKNNLSTRDRLELFTPVCRAVQHAHQKGIIHRDIKPSNILLTLHDGLPVPKIIDFGIAKATSGRLTQETLFTEFNQLIGTPEYMSPEQAEMSGLDIDTRTDIYSLGVVLYELLTGTTPFDPKQLRGAAYGEILRIIRTVEPPKPSTRVSAQRGTHSDVAAHRRSDPQKLSRLIRGELDWIVMKCLEKDRTRRYETANGLAMDLQRYLHDEPVSASPPSPTYKLRKFAQKYRAPLRAAAAILVLLIAGGVVSAWQAVRATRAETAATIDLGRALKAEHDVRQALMETQQAKGKEEAARRLAVITMCDMQTAFGLTAGERGETEEATLWFANAASLAREDPLREQANRVRWKSWLRQSPAPVNALAHDRSLLRSLALHPTGKYLLVTDIDDRCTLWDLRSESRIDFPSDQRGICSAVWSPDGQYLAIGTLEGRVGIYTFPEFKLRHQIEHRGAVRALLYSRDGQRLALASEIVRVWDFQTESFITPELVHPKPVKVMSFNASGDRLATACTDEKARIFKVGPGADAQPLFAPVPHSLFDERGHVGGRPVPPLFVNGSQFISWPRRSYPATMIWRDVETGNSIRTIGLGTLDTVAISPDGRLLVTGNVDGARLWSVTDGRFLANLPHRNNVLWATFSPDGRTLSTACADGFMHRFAVPTSGPPTPIVSLIHQSSVHLCADAGQLLASAQEGGLVRVWQLPLGNTGDWIHVPAEKSMTRMAISSDGQFTWPRGTSYRNMRGRATQVLEIGSGRNAGPELAPGGYLIDVAISPNRIQAALLASPQSNATGKLHIWNSKTGERIFSPLILPTDPRSLAYAPTQPRLAVLCGGGQVLLVNTAEGKIERELNCGPVKYLVPFNYHCNGLVRFSPDGRRLLAWGLNDAVQVWDVSTGEQLPQTIAHDQQIHDVQFSPDGRYLATASSDNTVRVWDFEAGKEVGVPLRHPDHVFRARFSSDGNCVLTACRDSMARLWNWRSANLVCPPFQHYDEVFDASFVPGGPWIVTASKDGTARLWESRTGTPVAPPWYIGSAVLSVEVAADGKFAVASGFSGEIHGFDLSNLATPTNLPPEDLVLAGEILSAQRVQAGSGVVKLTAEEWLERWQRFHKSHPDFFRANSDDNRFAGGSEPSALSPNDRITVLEARLKLQSANLGPDDLDTLRTMLGLGGAYRVAANPAKAITIYERLLALCVAKLPPGDALTQNTENDLSVAYIAAGRLSDAATILEKRLEVQTGPHDINSLRSMSNLAGVYRDLGRLDAAMQLYERTLKLRRERLGPDHPDTVATIADMVPLYLRLAQYGKAETLLVETYERFKGGEIGMPTNNWQMYAIRQLVSLYDAWGKHDQADVWRAKLGTSPATTHPS